MNIGLVILCYLIAFTSKSTYAQDELSDEKPLIVTVEGVPRVIFPCNGLGLRCQTVVQPTGVALVIGIKASCKQIKDSDNDAPSGEYFLRTSNGKVFKAYCEMGLNGGGYTFLHPTAMAELTDADVQAIFNDKSSFLMRYRENNGRQSYAVLEQLNQYSQTPLMIGLNHNTGYTSPVNQNPSLLGGNFLYFGFLPISIAASNSIQGLKVNGNQVTFFNSDRNPNSHLTLFPNFAERTPSTYGNGFSAYGPVCARIESLRRQNPSGRVMPGDYFLFMEMHWGGGGCYGQTDHRSNTILGTNIGFH